MPKGKVVVGMSGGIDSAAAASILVAQGLEVVGMTLKVWEEEEKPDRRWQERSCCKIGLARYVAQRLGIPHHVVDARRAFREGVIGDFISQYERGKTPNPCIRCNERIKFGFLFEAARELGADYLATGHYVRVEADEDGKYELKQGLDSTKDQSYFLYRLKSSMLPHLIFPLGTYQKKDVWKWMDALDLPPDEIRESQEICFVTQGDYRTFLRREAPKTQRPGSFVRGDGEVLGQHEGVGFYTVGQRRGLGLSSDRPGERLYVIGIHPERNQVQLGVEEDLYTDSITAQDLNTFQPVSQLDSMDIQARVRYRSPKIPARLRVLEDDKVSVRFNESQRGVTPGQSVVFYQGENVMGGGIISSVGRNQVERE